MKLTLKFWILMLCLCASLQVPAPTRAYEGDHYVWTYYLARHCGYTHRQAFQIASAAYAIDFDPNTGPMPAGLDWIKIPAGFAPEEYPRKWTKFHAFRSAKIEAAKGDVDKAIRANADALLVIGFQQKNPGPYIHFIQDIYAHAGYNDIRGHGAMGHAPDFISFDKIRAQRMTAETLSALEHIRFVLTDKTKKSADPVRVAAVLKALIAANPYPAEFDVFRNEHVLDASITAALLQSPQFNNSYQVVLKALYEDYKTGLLASFPDKTINERDPSIVKELNPLHWKPVMPEEWRQYKFDRDARAVEDGSYALENVKVTFDAPSVKVEIPSDQLLGPEAIRALVPQYGDPARNARRVTVKLPYHLRGIVPSLGPLPVVEHAGLGAATFPTFWGKHTLVRYVATKGFDAELELTTFVSTDECEKNKVQLSAAIQIHGEDPHWAHFQLTTTQPNNSELLRQAVMKAGFARIALETPTGFTAYSAAQDALDGSSVTVVEFASPAAVEAHLRRSFGPELTEAARRSLGSLTTFGTSVTARRWYLSKEAEYVNLYTRQTVGGQVYGFGFIEYALVLNGTILLDLLKVFPAPETAPVSKMEIEEQGEAAMHKLAVELVALGPSNASAFTLKPLSPGVAPKIASKPPASTALPKVVPKRVPEPSTLPRTGTKAGKIPLPPMPKQDKDLPPLGSVGHVVAENFGTHALVREGKLVLTDVVRGSPGEGVGLSRGDRILQIGDKSLEGLTAAELQALAHAPLRAPQMVTFLRGRDQAQVVILLLARTGGYNVTVTVIPKR